MDFIKKHRRSIIGFAISLAVSFAAAALLYYYQKDYHGTTLKDNYMMICNAFFVSGVLFFGIGALMLIALTGTFISIQFGFKVAGQMFLQFITGRYDKLDYIAYKAEKEAKEEERSKQPGKWRALIVGVINLVISFIFLRLYYSI